jgi:hypothetical protein
MASNPPFGAVFTYNVVQPLATDAKLVLTIADESGKQVRRMELDGKVGLQRAVWNLRTNPQATGSSGQAQEGTGQRGEGVQQPPPQGRGFGRGAQLPPLVQPGRYTATLGRMSGDQVTPIGASQSFRVTQIEQ